MKNDYQKSMEALQLAGKSKSAQEAYPRSVRQLVDFFEKTPDKLFEEDLKAYFLHHRNIDKWTPSTMRIAHTGIKFFFTNILKHDRHLLNYLNSKIRVKSSFLTQGVSGITIIDGAMIRIN